MGEGDYCIVDGNLYCIKEECSYDDDTEQSAHFFLEGTTPDDTLEIPIDEIDQYERAEPHTKFSVGTKVMLAPGFEGGYTGRYLISSVVSRYATIDTEHGRIKVKYNRLKRADIQRNLPSWF